MPVRQVPGGVLVGIADDAALSEAWDKLQANIRTYDASLQLDGILIEQMAPRGGTEMIVGAKRDPQWGAMIVFLAELALGLAYAWKKGALEWE